MKDVKELYGKTYIFEIYVKQLELTVEAKKYIYFYWSSETTSFKSNNVLLFPGINKHRIEENLSFEYEFLPEHGTSTKLMVYEPEEGSEDKLVGECGIDLLKLLEVTNPVKLKLHGKESGRVPILTYVTARVVDSKESRSILSQVKDEDQISLKSVQTSRRDSYLERYSVSSVDDNEIYSKINKVSEKLSNIERDILKKTYKLNQLNKENMTEMNRMKTKLEKDIAKKDLQIKILLSQLDELHTALSISHQRELELTEQIRFCIPLNYDPLSRTEAVRSTSLGTVPKRLADDRLCEKIDMDETILSYNKSILSEIESNISELQKFKQEYEVLRDPTTKITKCKDLITNLQKIKKMPRLLTKSSIPVNELIEKRIPSVKTVQRSVKESSISGDLVPKTVAKPLLTPENLAASERSLLPKSTDFKGDLVSSMKDFKVSTPKSQARRPPIDSGMATFQPPKLVEAPFKMPKIQPGVFIPKLPSTTGSESDEQTNRRESIMRKPMQIGFRPTVSILERELVDTKVKLADSETEKQVYMNKLGIA